MDCPFCGQGAHKYHLGLNIAHGYFNCWQCGAHGLIPTLMRLSGETEFTIRHLLKEIEHLRIKEEVHTGQLRFPKGIDILLPAHRRYLRGRGFNPDELVNLWDISGIGISQHLGWRIFIPIKLNHEAVSWTTRAIGETNKRYISASHDTEAINHKSLLYGEDYAAHVIVIVEGPLDVWRIGPGAVATFGLNYSSEQVKRMVTYPVRVVCFDAEPMAQKQAQKLADTLSLFPGETHVIQLESGKDAADAAKSEIRNIRKRFL